MENQHSNRKKIISIEEFELIREVIRKEHKKVVHCHGVYDLLHPGHIIHLEQAKELGDVLVVSVTAARFVNKGPGRPYFSDELRLKTLAAMEVVDYVILSEYPTAIEVLEAIRPDLYVKGKEYQDYNGDITQNIEKEVNKVRQHGGDVHFTDGQVFSSTRLINNSFSVLSEEAKNYQMDFVRRYSFDDIKNCVEGMKNMKVLVIGDIIIDEYVFCNIQGLISKDRAMSGRYLKEERYLGGSLAIARHLASFCRNVTVTGIVGDEPHIHSQILADLSRSMYIDLQYNHDFKTVVKRRYIEQRGIRNEFDKIFSMNFIDQEQNKKVNRENLYRDIEKNISNYDMVLVADYGHGIIDDRIMEIVQAKSKFLALNCQTNSSNYGMNLITKYNCADVFTLDEREIRLAFSNNNEDLTELLRKLRSHLGGKMGWLTMGSRGAMVIEEKNENIVNCPAFTLNVQDTIGAGDAFLALASLSAVQGAPAEIGLFLGNIAGALASNILGNSKPVTKLDLLRFATTLTKI